ncbi:MAG: glycosyltransferase family 4 protein [Planctomycetes bacterium]|nr:glycosyltransferase family 4 protein [Planctomycetota bacterium]
MRLVYLLARYPVESEGFIRREIRALRERGIVVEVHALVRAAAADADLEPAASYRPPLLSPASLLPLAGAFLASPWKFLCATASLLALHRSRPLHQLRILRNLPAACRIARRLGPEHGVFLYAHFVGLPADLAFFISHLTGRPFGISGHAADLCREDPVGLEKKIQAAAFTAVCSAWHCERLCRCLPRVADKIHLVRHGLFPEDHELLSRPWKGRNLAAGRLVEKKGHIVLLRALAELARVRRVECEIAGEGPLRGPLEDFLKASDLFSAVAFVGQRRPADMASLYAKSDLLVHPSVEAADGDMEGIPNVILEAMMHGLPVVASRTAGIPEALVDGESGILVEPGDPAALAAALTRLLDDPALAQRMGRCGREKALREFDQRRNIEALLSLIETVDFRLCSGVRDS